MRIITPVDAHWRTWYYAGMSNAIRDLRLERIMSQKDLAEASGVSKRTIQRIEAGQAAPNGLVAAKLARFFKIDLATIERNGNDE